MDPVTSGTEASLGEGVIARCRFRRVDRDAKLGEELRSGSAVGARLHNGRRPQRRKDLPTQFDTASLPIQRTTPALPQRPPEQVIIELAEHGWTYGVEREPLDRVQSLGGQTFHLRFSRHP